MKLHHGVIVLMLLSAPWAHAQGNLVASPTSVLSDKYVA